MSTPVAVLCTLLVLGASGALPVLLLVGPRVVALPLMPLAGSVLAAASAVCTITLAGGLWQWFLVWSCAAAAAAAAVFVRHPDRARVVWQVARRGTQPIVVLGALAILAALAWTLRTLRVPTVGFDARAIWILHARWLSHGHAFALAAIRNQFLELSHPGYPPLVSSVMALAWQVSGTSSDRVAVVTVAMLNACALFVAAWGLVEVARRAASSLGAGPGSRLYRLVLGSGIAVALLAVLVTGGVLGTFATNGYADPLWSLAAVGVVAFGLALPPRRTDLAVAGILVAVAGLTKVEGIGVAMVLVAVVSVRLAIALGSVHRARVVAGAGLAALAALAAWPVITLVLGVPTDPSLTGPRLGSLVVRAHATLGAMTPHLHVVLVAVACGVIGLLLLRPIRERLGLANDLWTWGALAGGVLVLAGAYVFGPGNVQLWLNTSVNRTTIFEALLAWWIVAIWAVCGAAAVAVPPAAVPPAIEDP